MPLTRGFNTKVKLKLKPLTLLRNSAKGNGYMRRCNRGPDRVNSDRRHGSETAT